MTAETPPDPETGHSSVPAHQPAQREGQPPVPPSPSAPHAQPPPLHRPQEIPFQFTGKAGEFFRIWIVNTALTIVTLGIYAAWAKVRHTRYIYNHLDLGGHRFDFHANPVRILIGNIIVSVLFVTYTFSGLLHPFLPLTVLLVFLPLFPWLYYKAIRFRAHNTSYRNIRFRFKGTLGESYLINLVLGLAIPITFGLLYPYQAFRRKQYIWSNMAFGATPFRFTGSEGPFFKYYLLAFGIAVAGYFLASTAFLTLFVLVGALGQVEPDIVYVVSSQLFSVFVAFVVIGFATQLLRAKIHNYVFSELALGSQVRFRCDLEVGKLFSIFFTNGLAIVFSLGLLIPWAKIRMVCYVTSRMSVEAQTDLDSFVATTTPEDSALGEAAADFGDFEIGFGI